MIEFISRDHPGRSAARHYKEVGKAWRLRIFGRRGTIYAWGFLIGLLFLIVAWHLSSRWALFAGITLGMLFMAVWMLPDALMPGHIFNWQLGAWGEQMTAKELKRLARSKWVVRHDVRWGERGNHDHVVAGPAVYVLNSKNVKDSRVTVEGKGLRLQRLDDPDASYLADRWVPSAAGEATSLKRELDRQLGFPVAVYPVVVLWGTFDDERKWIGDVCVIRGDKIVEWIEERPADLKDPGKRAAVAEVVRALPRA